MIKKIFFLAILLFSLISQAQIVNIPDANFKNTLVNIHCVDTDEDGLPDSDVDTNNDGEIQVSEAEAVLWLLVNEREISSLEGIQYFNNLEWLNCINNQITGLDMTQNLSLQHLECYSNQLTSLVISQNQNLINLYCMGNELTSLDVTQNPNLRVLGSSFNELIHLDVSQNPNLELLGCHENQLTSLNIKNGNNHNMTFMWAYNNNNLNCITVDDVNYANDQNCNDDDWCKDDITSYSENCVFGIDDFNQLSFKLYPNPAQDDLNIESQEPIDFARIYSLNGSLLKEATNSLINVSELPAGLYFVQIIVGANSVTKKFVKF